MEDLSIREISRRTGIHRDTISKYLSIDKPVPPKYQLTKDKSHPVLGPYLPMVKQIIEEDKNSVIAQHPRLYGRNQDSIILDHYLELLLQKSRFILYSKVDINLRRNIKMDAALSNHKPAYDLIGMDKLFYKAMLKDLFTETCIVRFWDGEEVTYGSGPGKFKIILHEPIPKAEVISEPSITLGEAYMHGKLEIEGDLQKFLEGIFQNLSLFLNKNNMYSKMVKIISNSIKRSRDNAQYHYDIGNDFYRLWLDDSMTYSCGYFENENDTLNQAQINKIKHILKKLNLSKGQSLLDIGCGWGGLIIAAAKEYGVKATGITLSTEQYSEVKRKIRIEGLDDYLDAEIADYRELKGKKFDRIVSVGMIEHVGKDHIHEYFQNISNLLNPGGLSMLHCITTLSENEGDTNPWIDKYIFPGGYIPNIAELISCMSKENFYLLDAESLRRHYGRTLENWAANFEQALPEIEKNKDETFIRMWRLYLNSCAASFNCGHIDVHQFLFSKNINENIPWCRNYIYQ